MRQDLARQMPPWVVVAAGVHDDGGMDRANAALVRHLAALGHHVHVVTHKVDDTLAGHARVSVHHVPKTWGSFLLGEIALRRAGQRVARRTTADSPEARVLVNGGNCEWPDINWVHYVHGAARCYDAAAPLWFKVKNRLANFSARVSERRALRRSHVVVSNSKRTTDDLVVHLGVDRAMIDLIYLGSDSTWIPPDAVERANARMWLGIAAEIPVVAFVGALGHDQRKGFDTLWAAWRSLCADPLWDAVLVIAGGGRALDRWCRASAEAEMAGRVRFLGFTRRIRELLAVADLLVSPVRYESYGLNVQEALCRGVPAIVARTAGVAERYTPEMQHMLLNDVESAAELEQRLRVWRGDIEGWKRKALPLSAQLRAHTWDAMAAEIVALAESRGRSRSPINR